MNDEMRTEAMELCVTACEKFSTNNEVNKFCLLQMLINLIMIVAAWIPNRFRWEYSTCFLVSLAHFR